MNETSASSQMSGRRQQRGVGLVELMISVVIGLLIVAMVTSYYLSSRQSYQTTVVSGELTNGQRYAMQLLSRQLLLTGYSDSWMNWGEVFDAAAADGDMPAFAEGQVIAGKDSGGAESDEVWLRYRAAALADQPVVGCTNQVIVDSDDVVVMRLYLSNDTLRCDSHINGGKGKNEPLLNGVEAIAFTYLDDSGSFQSFGSANWMNVRAVRIELLVSSETSTFDAPVAQSFDWLGETLTFNDRRMRARLSRVVTLRNIMERR